MHMASHVYNIVVFCIKYLRRRVGLMGEFPHLVLILVLLATLTWYSVEITGSLVGNILLAEAEILA